MQIYNRNRNVFLLLFDFRLKIHCRLLAEKSRTKQYIDECVSTILPNTVSRNFFAKTAFRTKTVSSRAYMTMITLYVILMYNYYDCQNTREVSTEYLKIYI